MNRALLPVIMCLILSALLMGQQSRDARSVKLADGDSIVEPGTFVSKRFDAPPRCSELQVNGRFTAKGGAKNDIEVYVLDEDGFVNFTNRNHAEALYNSGRVTQATLDLSLPKNRTYYLVFNNRFSVVSNKVVTAAITANYSCQN